MKTAIFSSLAPKKTESEKVLLLPQRDNKSTPLGFGASCEYSHLNPLQVLKTSDLFLIPQYRNSIIHLTIHDGLDTDLKKIILRDCSDL